jgi:uncharacterized protein
MSDNGRMNAPTGLPIELDMDAIAAFCERNHIRKLSLFGSVLRDDFGPESDVDVLVEFEEGYRPGLAFFGMGDELAEILGRKVDFLTEKWVHERFVDRVKAEALQVYAAA